MPANKPTSQSQLEARFWLFFLGYIKIQKGPEKRGGSFSSLTGFDTNAAFRFRGQHDLRLRTVGMAAD